MIRRATYGDVPGLRRLFALLITELEATRPVAYPTHNLDDLDAFTLLTARRIANDPTMLCYVAIDDATGECVAFLGGEIGQRALGQPRVFGAAHWLYVMPHARKLGLARALVRLACEDLVAIGITHVELAALRGDLQWATRGWIPYLIHHVLPIEAVVAGATEQRPAAAPPPPPPPAPEPEPPPVAAVAPAPPSPPRRKHRRRTPPPPPRIVQGGRA
ncbi:MAG TPA: GNAT family N-acetyltransferase [Gaiellales bacterium]|nr:GNAT family N-acetyltransferase [Gaiellales bacterium]